MLGEKPPARKSKLGFSFYSKNDISSSSSDIGMSSNFTANKDFALNTSFFPDTFFCSSPTS
jgi:hypothetical protein